jgi:alpha-mannosidase/mannosylglycerate hydrolase
LHCEKLVEYPAAQLNYAWRLLLQNQPHDSICGCSVDEVHREMMHRTAKFHQVLNVLERRATESIYGTEAGPFLAALKNPLLVDAHCLDKKLVMFNLSAIDSDAPVMMEWCTAVSSSADFDVAAESLPRLDGADLQIQLVERSLQTHIFTGTNQFPETKKVLVNRAWVAPNIHVPAFGYRGYSFKPKSGDVLADEAPPSSPLTSLFPLESTERSAERTTITNGLLTVAVDSDGAVKVTASGTDDKRQEFVLNHRIKDLGDAGDTYNFDPLENDEALQARFIEANVVSRGPLVSSILLKYELGLPAGLEFSSALNLSVENGEATADYVVKKARSTVHISHVFFTEIELRKSVPIVFFETKWENLSKDHRLEVLIDTGSPVTKVFSENHFSILERDCPAQQVSLPVEKGTEAPLDRYPCQRFFFANDQAFFNAGLPEFGVEGESVSLTILRATSALSRPDLRSRGGGAGPAVETPEANCLGLNRVNYGWAPLEVSFPRTPSNKAANVYQLAEQFENLSWITFGAMTAPSRSFLHLTNESIRVVATRILEANDFVELRLLNVTEEVQLTQLAISFEHCEALMTSADGRVVEVLNAMDGTDDNDANRDSISCAPEIDAFVAHAIYKIKLGVNALVSIRLRLKSRQTAVQPRAGS